MRDKARFVLGAMELRRAALGGIGDAGGDRRCARRDDCNYGKNRLCSLNSMKFFTRSFRPWRTNE
jgi:hypothetical protein